MIDVDCLNKSIIKHKAEIDGSIEQTDCEAICVDEDDGLACSLGFQSGDISKVDYCVIDETQVQLIELTDFKKNITRLKIQIGEAKNQSNSTYDKKLHKTMWKPIVTELKLKYQGSFIVIERLFRINNLQEDPNCQLLIVCKNDTDIIIMDLLNKHLKVSLEGMIRNGVSICKTKHACDQLIIRM